ncbi:MAG: hypothetical protein QOD03_1497 [Verrucomicrobiota bacterium]
MDGYMAQPGRVREEFSDRSHNFFTIVLRGSDKPKVASARFLS